MWRGFFSPRGDNEQGKCRRAARSLYGALRHSGRIFSAPDPSSFRYGGRVPRREFLFRRGADRSRIIRVSARRMSASCCSEKRQRRKGVFPRENCDESIRPRGEKRRLPFRNARLRRYGGCFRRKISRDGRRLRRRFFRREKTAWRAA